MYEGLSPLQLSPKALNVLASIKDRLTTPVPITEADKVEESVMHYTPEPKKEPKTTVKMRHARHPNAFQRMCQRREFKF